MKSARPVKRHLVWDMACVSAGAALAFVSVRIGFISRADATVEAVVMGVTAVALTLVTAAIDTVQKKEGGNGR